MEMTLPKTSWDKETGRIFCFHCGNNGFKKSVGISNRKQKPSQDYPNAVSVSYDYTVYMKCISCGQRHKEFTQHYGF